jgi:hypothetical protein
MWQRYLERFRRVSDSYPGRVTRAYGGDISRAMRDGDQKVAAVVTAWEKLLPDDGRLIQAPSQA